MAIALAAAALLVAVPSAGAVGTLDQSQTANLSGVASANS